MRKKWIIILGIFGILAVLVYSVLNFFCKVNVKCMNCTQTSISLKESKRKGLYLMDYEPLSKIIHLKNHDETIRFKNAWVETQWFYNSSNCLNTKLERKAGYNVVFEFEKSKKDSFLFTLTPYVNGRLDPTSGGIQETKKEIRLDALLDTLWLQIHEKNPDKNIGWMSELYGDRIGFVKKR